VWRAIMIAGGAVAATGLLGVLAGSAQARPKAIKLTAAIVALAKKWAASRGLPPAWVLATILVESGGDPSRVGDFHVRADGASIGLMQVNTVAHADRLAAAGVTREQLFDPNRNLEWGTKILREAYDRVTKALGPNPPLPLDQLVRLAYKGVDVISAVRGGRDPRLAYVQPVARWSESLVRSQALV
jgi:transglycosylase-like protein with SLT domain